MPKRMLHFVLFANVLQFNLIGNALNYKKGEYNRFNYVLIENEESKLPSMNPRASPYFNAGDEFIF